MVAANPFVYGEITPESAFADREHELERLVADLSDGQKIFLISPRRYGKSSLVHRALAMLARRRVVTLEITVSSFSSYVGFLEGYARALVGLNRRPADLRTWVRELFTSIKPEIRPGVGTAVPVVAFPSIRTERDADRLAEEVFALPARVTGALGRPLAIALDEFQAVTAYNGGSVEQALRAAVQKQRDVGYVLSGSEPTLMERMIGPKRPFYKAGPVMRLGKIPADVFAEFIETRFQESGIRPDEGLGASIVDLSGNLPYDVQRLAHETWDDVFRERRRQAALEDLHGTLRRLLDEQAPLFEAMWQQLTLAQRGVLRAIVIEHGVEILGAETRARHRLGGASSVQGALAALRRLDMIDRDENGRYAVVDSLMREWVARRTY